MGVVVFFTENAQSKLYNATYDATGYNTVDNVTYDVMSTIIMNRYSNAGYNTMYNATYNAMSTTYYEL